MDGTVADLYSVEGWLPSIRAEEHGLFLGLAPMVDMNELMTICESLVLQGWTIGVITWSPMNCSEEYHRQVSEEKQKWLRGMMPQVTEFYCLHYGTPKQNAPYRRASLEMLVDDNNEVLKMWDTPQRRQSINASNSETMMNILRELAD